MQHTNASRGAGAADSLLACLFSPTMWLRTKNDNTKSSMRFLVLVEYPNPNPNPEAATVDLLWDCRLQVFYTKDEPMITSMYLQLPNLHSYIYSIFRISGIHVDAASSRMVGISLYRMPGDGVWGDFYFPEYLGGTISIKNSSQMVVVSHSWLDNEEKGGGGACSGLNEMSSNLTHWQGHASDNSTQTLSFNVFKHVMGGRGHTSA